jgi:hypothetical protein
MTSSHLMPLSLRLLPWQLHADHTDSFLRTLASGTSRIDVSCVQEVGVDSMILLLSVTLNLLVVVHVALGTLGIQETFRLLVNLSRIKRLSPVGFSKFGKINFHKCCYRPDTRTFTVSYDIRHVTLYYIIYPSFFNFIYILLVGVKSECREHHILRSSCLPQLVFMQYV